MDELFLRMPTSISRIIFELDPSHPIEAKALYRVKDGLDNAKIAVTYAVAQLEKIQNEIEADPFYLLDEDNGQMREFREVKDLVERLRDHIKTFYERVALLQSNAATVSEFISFEEEIRAQLAPLVEEAEKKFTALVKNLGKKED